MLRRFIKDEDGVSALEFALIAPVFIILFFGTVEVSNLLSVNRKVTRVASTVADLVAQDSLVNKRELDGIFDASEAIATPFDTSKLSIVVSSVYKDFDDEVEVEWCYARNGAGSDEANVPDDLLEQNSSVILAEVSYDYEAAFSVILDASYQLSDEFYLRPRRSVRVDCEDCDC